LKATNFAQKNAIFSILAVIYKRATSDLKERLLRVIEDPHFSRRERQLAKSSLERIVELEQEDVTDWTEKAKIALINEVHKKVVGKQAAVKIGSFLKRHIR
jgi:hypothetical protein